jgi:predicted DCC family thiol-disulfide oxidoreductase YuxK
VKSDIKLASSLVKPCLIFDGECTFCAVWLARWRHLTGDRVDYLPFQDTQVATRFPELRRGELEAAVHFIDGDGTIYSGAEAVFRALATNPHEHWFLDWYCHSPFFAQASERGYRLVARHRKFFSTLTRLAWGKQVLPPEHVLVRSVFLRALALIYFAAFLSLWTQIHGLVGSKGILPADLTMAAAQEQANSAGLGAGRFHVFPTFCWLGTSDSLLTLQCAAGLGCSLLLLFGIAPAPCLLLLWAIYLSLCTVCREFLGFQWDVLLLETGFLAIFFAPLKLIAWGRQISPPSRIVLWLLRWLLFRLMFQSGCVKLLSGDKTWHDLTALNFHFETQPLPTCIGWCAHQLPSMVLKGSTAAMFFVELALPFLIFGPRRFRMVAAGGFVLLQFAILLTGNYCFFNLLTIALSLLLLDDDALRAFFRLKSRAIPNGYFVDEQAAAPTKLRSWPRQATIPLACITLIVTFMQCSSMFPLPVPWPRPFVVIYRWLMPFRTFNSYGLFAVMTTARHEIIFEGSNDGVTWLEYEFKYKPGNLKRVPGFVAPHQPRLDWQMWFAALGRYEDNPWLVSFCLRLLQGSPSVLSLLEHNPFPNAPPRYIRAVVYDYHFTDFALRRKKGEWWRRQPLGTYLPSISLREVR